MDFTDLKDFMNHLTEWRMPGNTACVYVDGKEVFRYSTGYASIEKKTPMQGDEFINIYSCSKPVTVTAALQLYERGFFRLDDPLYDIIPEYKHMHIQNAEGNVREAKNPITLRHLFTMTSGLSYNSNTKAFEKARKLTEGKMDTLTVIRCLAEEPLSFEPGEAWQYSLSHDVLAAVVEIVSGKRFSRYVDDHIFKPLDMRAVYHNESVLNKMAEQYQFASGVETDVVKMQMVAENRADGHLVNVGKEHNVLIFGSEYDSGGAGITTTVPDYAKFACALAGKGRGATGERILAPETIDLLRTNQLSDMQRKEFSVGKFCGYGYGLGVRTMMEPSESEFLSSVGEFGWGGAAGANLVVDPDKNVGLFYAHHMLNPAEEYYQPRLINALYSCL